MLLSVVAISILLNLDLAAALSLNVGAQSVRNIIRSRVSARRSTSLYSTGSQAVFELEKTPKFPELYFEQNLDHFDANQKSTFRQRYWVNARHYKPGGPVFVIDGGETSGEDRLPFLDTGIADIIPAATKGLGIVLEHRYYGASIPVQNFSTDSMRWLNNAQSLEDSARFMRNFTWRGRNLSAPNTKWIYYGGSYAGARAAHMRVLYPDLVFGAIASSAVTHAEVDYWQYFDAIRTTQDPECIGQLREGIDYVDALLSRKVSNPGVKALFGLSGLADDDFASVLSNVLGFVQATNWDSEVSSDAWSRFCTKLGSGLAHSSWRVARLQAIVFNYASFVRKEIVSSCDGSPRQCFDTSDATAFQETSLENTWRAWTWQYCNEWGYLQGAPPFPDYPTLVSRKLTLEYTSRICRQAFPAGKYARVPLWPNVTAVNSLGDFGLAYDRLAFLDGFEDPWRPATPHSDEAPERNDTVLRPFKIIQPGVHHWDENGLRDHSLEPLHIQEIHHQMVAFVKAWLKIA